MLNQLTALLAVRCPVDGALGVQLVGKGPAADVAQVGALVRNSASRSRTGSWPAQSTTLSTASSCGRFAKPAHAFRL
jgi:hypothetical protein